MCDSTVSDGLSVVFNLCGDMWSQDNLHGNSIFGQKLMPPLSIDLCFDTRPLDVNKIIRDNIYLFEGP